MTSPIFSQENQAEDPLKKYPDYFAEEIKKTEQSGGDSRFFDEFVQMMIYLSGIIAFMVFFMWVLKRMMAVKIEQSNRKSSIKILETRSLSQKTTVYVIGAYGKAYTLTESVNGITRLGETSLEEKGDSSSFDEYMTP